MKAADRIEDFRKAVEVLLGDEFSVIVLPQKDKRFYVGARHRFDQPEWGAMVGVNISRPDLRKPIPYERVQITAETLTALFHANSMNPTASVAVKVANREAYDAIQEASK